MRQRTPYRCIGVDAAAGLLQRHGVLRLDVRDAASFAKGHVADAQRVSHANLSALIAGTEKNRPILIYCYHGHASREYAQTFSDFGFAEVYSLDGGFEASRNGLHTVGRLPEEATQHWLAAPVDCRASRRTDHERHRP
jgi:thiosulfate/3-mercaptopyruvate sulfurtransferase